MESVEANVWKDRATRVAVEMKTSVEKGGINDQVLARPVGTEGWSEWLLREGRHTRTGG